MEQRSTIAADIQNPKILYTQIPKFLLSIVRREEEKGGWSSSSSSGSLIAAHPARHRPGLPAAHSPDSHSCSGSDSDSDSRFEECCYAPAAPYTPAAAARPGNGAGGYAPDARSATPTTTPSAAAAAAAAARRSAPASRRRSAHGRTARRSARGEEARRTASVDASSAARRGHGTRACASAALGLRTIRGLQRAMAGNTCGRVLLCGRTIGGGRLGGAVVGSAGRRRSVRVRVRVGAEAGVDVRAIGGMIASTRANAEEAVGLGSDTHRCAVPWGREWGPARDQVRVVVQLLESILAPGFARGAPLWNPTVGPARSHTHTRLGGEDRRDVGRRRGGVHIPRVTRGHGRGNGDGHPYQSYCFGEASRIDQLRKG